MYVLYLNLEMKKERKNCNRIIYVFFFSPIKICPMLHLCPSEGETEEAVQVTSGKPDVSCVVCEYALTQLEDMLEDNRTEVSW